MENTVDVHNRVHDTLCCWGYAENDVVPVLDIAYAIHITTQAVSSVCKYYIVCMQLSGDLIDYGDGLYGIGEESTT